MNPRYSNKALIILILLLFIGAAVASLDTHDVDELCNTTDTYLYRNSTSWTCKAINTTTTNITTNITNNITTYVNTTFNYTEYFDQYLNTTNNVNFLGIGNQTTWNGGPVYTDLLGGWDTTIQLSSDIDPSVDNNWELGKSNKRYKTIYTTTLQADNTYNKTDTYNRTEINELIPTALTYYFWNETDTVNNSYKIMNTTQQTTPINLTVTGLTDDQVIVYRVNRNTNLSGIGAGYVSLHNTVTKSTGTKTLKVHGHLFIIHTNNTIEQLTTTETSDELQTGITTNIILNGYIPQTSMDTNAVLLWSLNAEVTGAGTAPTIIVTTGGTTKNGIDLPITLNQFTETDPIWNNQKNQYYQKGENLDINNKNITNISNVIISNTTSPTAWRIYTNTTGSLIIEST